MNTNIFLFSMLIQSRVYGDAIRLEKLNFLLSKRYFQTDHGSFYFRILRAVLKVYKSEKTHQREKKGFGW